MKNFNIRIISKKAKKIQGLLSHTCEIIIDDFKETWPMSLSDWTLEDYKQQWKNGLQRINTHNKSCLIVSVQNLKTKDPRVWIWLLYKVGNKIFFQNQLLMSDIVKELKLPIQLSDINPFNYYKFIMPRLANENNEGINEEGQKISEWVIELE